MSQKKCHKTGVILKQISEKLVKHYRINNYQKYLFFLNKVRRWVGHRDTFLGGGGKPPLLNRVKVKKIYNSGGRECFATRPDILVDGSHNDDND